MDRKTLVFNSLVAIGLFILLYLLITVRFVENLEIFTQINPLLLTVAFLLTNLTVVAKIFRWRYLSRVYGVDLHLTDASRVVIGSFLVSGITPVRIGDLIKAYIMKKKYGLPLIDGVLSIVYERVFEFILLFLVSLGILYIGLSAKNYIILQATSFLIFFIAIAYIFSDRLLVVAQKLLTKTRFVTFDVTNLRFNKIPLGDALTVFLFTGMALCLEFLRLWLVAFSFGFNLNIIHLSTYFSLAVIIGLISQIPIGIGVVEGSLAYFLIEAGLPSYYAFGIVFIDRIISMYYIMALGLLYYKWALKSSMEDTK